MAGFKQAIEKSLGLQALTLIFLLTLLLLILGAAWDIYSGRSEALRDMERRVTEVGGLLRQSIEKPLRQGDDPGTAAQFDSLRQNFPGSGISIAGFNGKITYSTRPEEIRSELGRIYPPEVLEACRLALAGQAPEGGIISHNGRRKFMQVTTIENEPRCYHCHGWSQPVLGAMLVLHDVEEDLQDLFMDNLGRIGASVLLAVLLSLLLFACVWRRFIQPVLGLADSSAGILAGNFNVGFTVGGEDELGRLSGNIGRMLGSLRLLGFARSVLENMSVPGVMCDSQGRVSLINAHMLDLLELDGETGDYLGQNVEILLYGRHLSTSVFSRILLERQNSLCSLEDLVTKSGGFKRARLDASLVYSPDGEFLGVFAAISDLTEICRREAAVLGQSAALNQAAKQAEVLLRELGESASFLIGQLGHTREQSGHQRQLSDHTAQALGEMQSWLGDLAASAAQTADQAGETRRGAAEGTEQARHMVISMKQIVEAGLQLKERMRVLGQKTDNIVLIMQTVQDIANESNLLALNAAVEADKAGEAGRGFVRVAGELRKLAEKTMQAITQVGSQAAEIQNGVRSGLAAVENTAENVDNGAGMVLEAEETLCAILASAKAGDLLAQSLATDARERLSAGELLNQSADESRELAGRILLAMTASEEAAQRFFEVLRRLETVLATLPGETDSQSGGVLVELSEEGDPE
ncbi:MAG: methyl-accepting chemotaxis protein [Deltaproteobacteria bacterium]|jgi:methyl-accepting chemotaxis protein|nr:methyl-accepting chemotaxis protein [Deltaproteobacteria bacterium]